jgi:tetratricopeptide (TPR) repeat protein
MTRSARFTATGVIALLTLAAGLTVALASDEFDRATRLAMVEDYEGALKEYEGFLYEHPKHDLAPVAAMAAGNLYLEILEDHDAAIGKYDVVVTDYRSSSWAPEAALRKGTALQSKEAWADAATAFELALDLNAEQGSPQSASWVIEATSNAATCYLTLENHQKVLDTYERALAASPPPEVTATALFRMGEAYESMEKPSDAALQYARVLEEAPCASGQIFAQVLGKRALVEEHTSLDLTPYDAYNESYGLIAQRDYAGALERCKDGEAATRNPALLECLEGRRIFLEGAASADFREGRNQMQAYMEKYPEGQLYGLSERIVNFWTSIVEAETQVEEDPENAAALSGLGVLYYYTGSFDAAIEIAERSQRLDPENVDNYEILGFCYYYTGRTEDAIRQFDYLVENSEPEDTRVFSIGGTACLTTEQYNKAVKYFERQVELSPEDPSAHSNLADGLLQAGRVADAEEACRKALELDPNSPTAIFILGQVHREQDDEDEAIRYYEQFLEIVPEGEQAEQAREAIQELRS